MPSRFKPCGLSQMYALRLGSLPIGRTTGGLAETINDGSTGFLFQDSSAESLRGGICRAFAAFGQKNKSYGWGKSAGSYRSLYGKRAAAA